MSKAPKLPTLAAGRFKRSCVRRPAREAIVALGRPANCRCMGAAAAVVFMLLLLLLLGGGVRSEGGRCENAAVRAARGGCMPRAGIEGRRRRWLHNAQGQE